MSFLYAYEVCLPFCAIDISGMKNLVLQDAEHSGHNLTFCMLKAQHMTLSQRVNLTYSLAVQTFLGVGVYWNEITRSITIQQYQLKLV